MDPLRMRVQLAAVLLAVSVPNAFGQGVGVTAEPLLREGLYCAQPSGSLIFRATVEFTFRNTGRDAVLLPRFQQVASYSLFPSENAVSRNRPEVQVQYDLNELFDITKIDQTKPDSDLFGLIAPGGSQTRILMIWIPLGLPRTQQHVLLGSDHYLRVQINNWFQSRKSGDQFRQGWLTFGLLWIDNVTSAPLRLHFDNDPTPQRCTGRVD